MKPQYTAIWQGTDQPREWVDEIFGPYVTDRVVDGHHRVVLDNCIVFDAFVYCHDPSYYAQFAGKNAFLVHFSDEFYEGRDYAIYSNFRGVFRNYWSNAFNPDLVMALPLGYTDGSRPTGPIPASSSRKFVWSLLGECSKSSRPDAAKALSRIEPHFFYSTDAVPGFTVSASRGSRGLDKAEYRRVLLDTIFAPCPMGNANIESYRVFEALECGAIPIVERRPTLDYYRQLLGPEFPGLTVRSWQVARTRIQELLKQPLEIDALQTRCLDWWRDYKKAYSSRVGGFIEQRSSAGSASSAPFRLGRVPFPFWRDVELIRHHSANAVCRRVYRQFSRLVRQRRWRVAYRPGHGPKPLGS